jgi:peptidyl-tRNA hydrolase
MIGYLLALATPLHTVDEHGNAVVDLTFLPSLIITLVAGFVVGAIVARMLDEPEVVVAPKALRSAKSKPSSVDVKMVLIVRKDLKLPAGDCAAACAQAAMSSIALVDSVGAEAKLVARPPKGTPEECATYAWPDWQRWWYQYGVAKVTLRANDAAEFAKVVAAARLLDVPVHVQQNAAGVDAVAAVGPAPASLINEASGTLKLF